MEDEDKVESLINRIVGQNIVGAGIDNDEFTLYIEDGTMIVFFSEEDLSLYYELPEKPH